MTEMVVAAFDSSSAVEAAIRDLENAQIPSAAIKGYSKNKPAYQDYGTHQPEHHGGFWSWVLGISLTLDIIAMVIAFLVF